MIAATYQAASGAGAAAMAELRNATGAYLAGRDFAPPVLRHPYAFNLFSHDTAVDPETGANGEETKVVRELRKIMQAPQPADRHHLHPRAGAAGALDRADGRTGAAGLAGDGAGDPGGGAGGADRR